MKKLLLFLFVASLFTATSCSRKHMQLQVLRPADVTVPSKIKTIAIVNHAAPKSKWWNIVEGILTGEMIEQDKKGKTEALAGLCQQINNGTRYKIINTTEVLTASGSITGKTFPDALSWNQVNSLCRKYNADAILALEHFDSDFIVSNASKRIKNDDGIMETRYIAKGTANVNLGFRLYDPQIKSIIDEESYTHFRVWESEGITAADAALHLIANAQGIYGASREAGEVYAERITPHYVNVERSYYQKSKKVHMLASGARHAEVNNWAKAEEVWKDALKATNDIKTLGRATYNLALCSEVNGDLEQALKWAQQSYAKYGNKKARTYSKILNQRIADEALLKHQMGN